MRHNRSGHGLKGIRSLSSQHRRKLKLEALEPRLVLTSLTLEQALGQLSGHSDVCSCPICTGQGLEMLEPAELSSSDPAAASPLSSLPQLHSNPGATAKLFLDFDGHYESSWGSWDNVSTPAFDQDGDRNTFSTGELAAIQEIWARVAEDYAPFQIDVTTVDPGNQTNGVTAVIAIGGNYSDWYGNAAGGVAFVGGFYNSSSNVGYVFEDALSSNPRYSAEAASHEAGHLFGLRHQSVWNGSTLVDAYNKGDGNWAPIMGSSYTAARSTWHNGTTTSSTTYQDDMAVIAGSTNGFGYKGDDFGNSTSAASNLPVSSGSVNLSGVIGQNGDTDVWRFDSPGGQVSFTLDVAQHGANLDAVLELRNSSGGVVASADPTGSFGASLSATLASGTYFVLARPAGGYGNVGAYTLRGTLTTVTASPEITVSDGGSNLSDGAALSFGTTAVGTSVSKTITVKNDGSETLTLTQLSQSDLPAGFSLVSGLGSTSLSAGQSTTFAVRLDATSAGDPTGTLTLANNDSDENPFDLVLSGTVQSATSTGGRNFDFGILGSPVESGHTAVYPQSLYSSAVGYGWRSGYITGANQSGSSALARDMNYTVDGTFAVDLPSGTYTVGLTMGDTTYHHDNMGIYLEGTQVDTVTPVVGQYTTRSYQVNVADGQLTLRLKDLGGSDPNAIINGLTITSASGSIASPPTIVSLTASPTSVLVGDPISLAAQGVSDPDGDVAKVRFYRDANGNAALDAAIDVLVGEDTSGGDGWTASASTSSLSAGSYTLLAIAEDQGGRTSSVVSAAVVVNSTSSGTGSKFDFGVLGSPVESGYTAVNPNSNYSSSRGFGWLSGYISGANQNSSSALSRDMNYTVDGTFAADVANGNYLVSVTMGDTTYHHDNMGIYLEGNLVDTVTPVVGQYTTNSYAVSVLDGQLTLRLKDQGGSDPNAIINGLVITPAGGSTASSPTLQSLSASPTIVAPGEPITLTAEGASDPDGDLARVLFYRDANGNGTLEPSTDIFLGQDSAGGDGFSVVASTEGLSESSYTFLAVAEDDGGRTSAVVSTAALISSASSGEAKKFDFGIFNSPLETGYTAVHPQTTYSSSQGYGWRSGYISGANQNSTSALSRDMNYTVDGTFAADVPSGTYVVTLTMGDTTYHHDNMGIYLEGNLVDTVTPVVGQYTTRSYQVTVGDGQLTLRLKDLGGSDANAIINGLTIEPVDGAAESLLPAAAADEDRLPIRVIAADDRTVTMAAGDDNEEDLVSAGDAARDAALAELLPDAAQRALAEILPEIGDRIRENLPDGQEDLADWIFSHWPDRLL